MTASRLELRSEVEDIKEENEIKIEGGRGEKTKNILRLPIYVKKKGKTNLPELRIKENGNTNNYNYNNCYFRDTKKTFITLVIFFSEAQKLGTYFLKT